MRAAAGSSGSGGAAGSRTVIVVPAPRAEVTSTVPPWAATIDWTMLSPSPEPGTARALASGAR